MPDIPMRTPEESIEHRDMRSWQRGVGAGGEATLREADTRGAPMNQAAGVGMAGFVAGLARPYRTWLVIIVLAMLTETLTVLAVPWPLKGVIDSVVGGDPPPDWVVWLVGPALAAGGATLASAAFSLVLLAMLGGIASYVDNYFTEDVGQWVPTQRATSETERSVP